MLGGGEGSSPQNALQDFKKHWYVVSEMSAFQGWSSIHFEFFQTFKHMETPPGVKQNLWANLTKPLKSLGSLLHLKTLVLCMHCKCITSCQRHPIRGMLSSAHFVRVAWKRGEGKQWRNTVTQDQVLSFWLRTMCLHMKTTQFYSAEVRKIWVAWAISGAHPLRVYSLMEKQNKLWQSVHKGRMWGTTQCNSSGKEIATQPPHVLRMLI